MLIWLLQLPPRSESSSASGSDILQGLFVTADFSAHGICFTQSMLLSFAKICKTKSHLHKSKNACIQTIKNKKALDVFYLNQGSLTSKWPGTTHSQGCASISHASLGCNLPSTAHIGSLRLPLHHECTDSDPLHTARVGSPNFGSPAPWTV